jgi:inhibitor of cysteine peptidase
MSGRIDVGKRLVSLVVVMLFILIAPLSTGAQTVETSGIMRLKVGQSRSVRLPETPSTGYGWQIDASAGISMGPVRITDRGYTRPVTAQGRVGAAGIRVWQLTGISPGTKRIIFVYIRPWQPGQVARRYLLTVQVAAR